MDVNIVECEPVERDRGVCVCQGGPSLEILKDVQRAYEQRMEYIERTGGVAKLQLQVDVLRSWVGDLVAQNSLLARAVEELESAAAAALLLEKRTHNEVVMELRAEREALRRRLARKDSDLRGLVEVLRRLREFDYCTLDGIHFFEVTESDIFGTVECFVVSSKVVVPTVSPRLDSKRLEWNYFEDEEYLLPSKMKCCKCLNRERKKCSCGKSSELKLLTDTLQKENQAKDREIRRLNKDMQQYEQTIINLRNEMSLQEYHTPDVSKKDAEVMAGMCGAGNECELEQALAPEKDYNAVLREETDRYRERIAKMEANLKSSGDSVRALHRVNAALSEELHAMRRVCAALDEQSRTAVLRAQFKDDIVREMRRQLRQAKVKLREVLEAKNSQGKECGSSPRYESSCAPTRRRQGSERPLHPESDDCRTPPLDGSGDDVLSLSRT